MRRDAGGVDECDPRVLVGVGGDARPGPFVPIVLIVWGNIRVTRSIGASGRAARIVGIDVARFQAADVEIDN